MKYFIYHIPGKKIGVTRNLDKSVTQQQGYAEGEYEVLFVSDDINQISKLEIPTGNPLLININENNKITDCKYLDSERAKDLVVF